VGVAIRGARRERVAFVDDQPSPIDLAFAQLDTWEVANVAAAVVPAGGQPVTQGDVHRVLRVASVGKMLAGYAIMIGVEEGAVTLDDPAGPPGSTLRHLLAHASGYGFESDAGAVSPPGTRRVYSNRGIEEAAGHLERATGMPFADYLGEAVLEPLGMGASELRGSPAYALHSTVADLVAFVRELQAPALLAAETLADMIRVHFEGLPGVLPGVGRFEPLDWGLTFERNFGRPGHWAGTAPSRETFGHFGGAGTFAWVDPVAEVACVVLGAREFGPWALAVWPPFIEAVLRAHAPGGEFVGGTT
jgi:CubicO group peptidase (beta-lactamase class C family)